MHDARATQQKRDLLQFQANVMQDLEERQNLDKELKHD